MAECWRGGGVVRAVDSWRFCCGQLPRRCKPCGVLIKGGGVGGGRCSDEEASIHRPTAADRLAHPGRGPRRARRGRSLPQEDRKCPSPERCHLHHCWSECQSSAMWTNQKAMSDARTALHSPPPFIRVDRAWGRHKLQSRLRRVSSRLRALDLSVGKYLIPRPD